MTFSNEDCMKLVPDCLYEPGKMRKLIIDLTIPHL